MMPKCNFIFSHCHYLFWHHTVKILHETAAHPPHRESLTAMFCGSFNGWGLTRVREMGSPRGPLIGRAVHSSLAGLYNSSAPTRSELTSSSRTMVAMRAQNRGGRCHPYSSGSGSAASGRAAHAGGYLEKRQRQFRMVGVVHNIWRTEKETLCGIWYPKLYRFLFQPKPKLRCFCWGHFLALLFYNFKTHNLLHESYRRMRRYCPQGQRLISWVVRCLR